MTCRLGALVIAGVVASIAPGCSLARDVIGNPNGVLDAGPGVQDIGIRDAGPRDAPAGCLTSCDDHDTCTTDTCDATGTCQHTNASGACDDHVLCNGADTCGGGTCSVHDMVNPCPGASHCDAMTNTCAGCATNADCPAPTMGMWSECDYGTDLCATTGMQTQASMTYACVSGACQATATSTPRACMRVTDGTMCAAMTTSDWTACAFADPCTRAGMESRITTTFHCMTGTCQATDTPEAQACMRTSTDGMSCGTTTTTDWSDCTVGTACGTTGTQTRTSTTYTCMGDACATMVSSPPEMQSCTVPSGGTGACGATTCDAWSACAQTMTGTCSQTGAQTRTCHTPTCSAASDGSGATCTGTTPHTEMQACSVDVVGQHVACANTYCGGCRTGPFQCPRGATGSQSCTTFTGTCGNGIGGPSCMTGFSSTTSSRPCTCS